MGTNLIDPTPKTLTIIMNLTIKLKILITYKYEEITLLYVIFVLLKIREVLN